MLLIEADQYCSPKRFRRFPLLALAILHHKFRKLPPRQARKVGSNLRNRADHVIMTVNQSSSFRFIYFPHSAFPQITHTPYVSRKDAKTL